MKSVRKQAYVSLQRYYNMTNNESIRTDILLVMFECLNDNELGKCLCSCNVELKSFEVQSLLTS